MKQKKNNKILKFVHLPKGTHLERRNYGKF